MLAWKHNNMTSSLYQRKAASTAKCIAQQAALISMIVLADRVSLTVHVSSHWILVQALAHTSVPNYDMPKALHCDHFDE